MMYLVEDNSKSGGYARYSFHYPDLVADFRRYTSMTDLEFIENVVDILHFACFVCFLKEIPPEYSVGDTGVIHELVHIVKCKGDMQVSGDRSLEDIRINFNRICKLE